jgi:hypothetical protein
VARVVVGLESGTLLVVRSSRHTAVAITGPEPPVALVVHDLQECLGRIRGLPKLKRKANSVDA